MTSEPATCAAMAGVRAEIDRLDREIVALLVRRAACIDRAVAVKRAEGLPARIGPRVEEVIANVARRGGGGGPRSRPRRGPVAAPRRLVDRARGAGAGRRCRNDGGDHRRQGASPRACARRIAGEVARVKDGHGRDAGPRRRARRRRSGERGLRPQQGHARPARRGCTPRSTACRPTPPRPTCSRIVERLNRDPAIHGILVQLPLPPQIDSARGARRGRAGQGRRRLPRRERRPPRARAEGDGALHAARLPDAAARPPRRPRRARGGRRRPLEHRRQADGAASPPRELHGDHCPFPHPRPRRRSAAAPTSSSPPSAARRWSGATGSSPARR